MFLDLAIRLVNGESANEGLLEVYHNEEWGTVCNYTFSTVDGNVACRQLGYMGVAEVYPTHHFSIADDSKYE